MCETHNNHVLMIEKDVWRHVRAEILVKENSTYLELYLMNTDLVLAIFNHNSKHKISVLKY
jgi:hypothetical protein